MVRRSHPTPRQRRCERLLSFCAVPPARSEFARFFGTCPAYLIEEGLFSDIAIAMHQMPHRSVSLALTARALGAVRRSKKAMALHQKTMALHRLASNVGLQRSASKAAMTEAAYVRSAVKAQSSTNLPASTEEMQAKEKKPGFAAAEVQVTISDESARAQE